MQNKQSDLSFFKVFTERGNKTTHLDSSDSVSNDLREEKIKKNNKKLSHIAFQKAGNKLAHRLKKKKEATFKSFIS